MKWIVATVFLAIAALPAHAATVDLGGTTWSSTNDCSIDEIDFDADGTAQVLDLVNDDQDSAHWEVSGNRVSITFDNWYGGIEARVTEDEISGDQTWKEDGSDEEKKEFCTFEPK